MQVDGFTLDKVRFDYARVLVSTSSLEILNTSAKVLVLKLLRNGVLH